MDAAIGFARSGRARAAALAVHDALAIDPRRPRVFEAAAELDRRAGRPEQARGLRARLDRSIDTTDEPDALEQRQARHDEREVPGILAVADEHRRRGRPRSAAEALLMASASRPMTSTCSLALSDERRMAPRPRAWHDGRYRRGWWEPG